MLRLICAAVRAISLAASCTAGTLAHATDADWGCQVLLCAASSAPSWHGIPYCVPPMMKLIAAMARPHFSWPVCHEAGTGAPGLERYAACPEGFSIGYSSAGGESGWSGEPNLCVKSINRCGRGYSFGSDGGGCTETISKARPLRQQPYYFDIRQTSGKTERFWFDLTK